MVRLYMDVHVPSAITVGLRQRGADVVTAQEDNTAELEDSDLLNRAAVLGRVLVTQDQDFLQIGADRQRKGEAFAGILYAPQAPGRIGQYLTDLELIALGGEPDEYANRVTYLPM